MSRGLQRLGCPPRRLGSYRDVPTSSRAGLSPARDTAPQRGAHSNPCFSLERADTNQQASPACGICRGPSPQPSPIAGNLRASKRGRPGNGKAPAGKPTGSLCPPGGERGWPSRSHPLTACGMPRPVRRAALSFSQPDRDPSPVGHRSPCRRCRSQTWSFDYPERRAESRDHRARGRPSSMSNAPMEERRCRGTRIRPTFVG
jgi:hypothetical protein